MLAILIPFRDRHAHLAELLPVLHEHLRTIPHEVVVVEQADDRPFNRGALLNAGFLHVRDRATHVCLHDVDMVPEGVHYGPYDVPTHLAGAASQFGYALPYPEYFGGVTAFPVADFARINGFHTGYWGWGAEDDDLLARCGRHGLGVQRLAGRFRSLAHPHALGSAEAGLLHAENVRLLRRQQQQPDDAVGLSSMSFALHALDTTIPGCTVMRVGLELMERV